MIEHTGTQPLTSLGASCTIFSGAGGTSSGSKHETKNMTEGNAVMTNCLYDVFLCYSRNNSVAADMLEGQLEEAGLRVFRDISSTPGGENWETKIEKAVKQSRSAIILMGESKLSPFQMHECRHCLDQARERDAFTIIPLLSAEVDKGSLPEGLDKRQAVSCKDISLRAIAERCCDLCNRLPHWKFYSGAVPYELQIELPSGFCRKAEIRTIPPSDGVNIHEADWQMFRSAADALHKQISNVGYTLSFDAVIGINEVGSIVSNRLAHPPRGGGVARVGRIQHQEGFGYVHLPTIPKGETRRVLLVDGKLKRGSTLIDCVKRVRKKYGSDCKIYYAVMFAYAKPDGQNPLGSLADLWAAERIHDFDENSSGKELNLDGFFLAYTTDHLGITFPPPLR